MFMKVCSTLEQESSERRASLEAADVDRCRCCQARTVVMSTLGWRWPVLEPENCRLRPESLSLSIAFGIRARLITSKSRTHPGLLLTLFATPPYTQAQISEKLTPAPHSKSET